MRALLAKLFRTSEQRLFEKTVARALTLQRAGFDIGFSYAPRYNDMPLLHVCEGRLANRWLDGIGFDCASRAAAFAKAASEAVERALWDSDKLYWNEHAIHATPAQLGERGIDLTKLSGFSSEQRATLPGLAFTPDTRFLYSSAVRLATGAPLFVPAQLVSRSYAAQMQGAEPLLRVPNSNGLATHETFDEAARRGLLELIERDAFMITFFNTITPPRIDPSSLRNPAIHSIFKELRETGFACDLMLLPTDMPVSVVCAVLRDESGVGPALCLGARADEDTEAAVLGALTEALGVYYLARRAALYTSPLPDRPLRTLERIAYWGKREHVHQLSWLWSGAYGELPRSRRRMNARRLAAEAEKRGCSVAAIAMTPPRLHELGLVSVCVVSPELQPLNLDEIPPYLGGARLASVPKLLGYTAKKAPPPYPHPFP